jgi:hypothetical protein
MIVADVEPEVLDVSLQNVRNLLRNGDRALALRLVLQPGIRLRTVPKVEVVLLEVRVSEIERPKPTETSTRMPRHFEQRVDPLAVPVGILAKAPEKWECDGLVEPRVIRSLFLTDVRHVDRLRKPAVDGVGEETALLGLAGVVVFGLISVYQDLDPPRPPTWTLMSALVTLPREGS